MRTPAQPERPLPSRSVYRKAKGRWADAVPELARELLTHGHTVILESRFWLRSDCDEERFGARALGAGVGLHHLDVDLDELWRRLHARNQAAVAGTVLATRAQLNRWAGFFNAPDAAEVALFDPPRSAAPARDVRR